MAHRRGFIRRGQGSSEYALILTAVIAGILAMSFFYARAKRGQLKKFADGLGPQFSLGDSRYKKVTQVGFYNATGQEDESPAIEARRGKAAQGGNFTQTEFKKAQVSAVFGGSITQTDSVSASDMFEGTGAEAGVLRSLGAVYTDFTVMRSGTLVDDFSDRKLTGESLYAALPEGELFDPEDVHWDENGYYITLTGGGRRYFRIVDGGNIALIDPESGVETPLCRDGSVFDPAGMTCVSASSTLLSAVDGSVWLTVDGQWCSKDDLSQSFMSCEDGSQVQLSPLNDGTAAEQDGGLMITSEMFGTCTNGNIRSDVVSCENGGTFKLCAASHYWRPDQLSCSRREPVNAVFDMDAGAFDRVGIRSDGKTYYQDPSNPAVFGACGEDWSGTCEDRKVVSLLAAGESPNAFTDYDGRYWIEDPTFGQCQVTGSNAYATCTAANNLLQERELVWFRYEYTTQPVTGSLARATYQVLICGIGEQWNDENKRCEATP
jgi:hypothetical protein